MSLKSIDYSRGKMLVLDQLELPHRSIYIDIGNSQDAWSVIRSMQVRGAPLIAITAALGLAVEAEKVKITITSLEDARSFLLDKMAYLRTSRPTAVNLFTATDQLTALVNELASRPSIQAVEVFDGFIEAAERMLEEDIKSNRSIGTHGAQRILDIVLRDKVRVLTICNTGSLATAGFGTALGVVRSLHEQGRLEHVYACETRPYNQGARLTAYEIVEDDLPGTLITDSMASTLMSVKGVDCVIVGADRVAANGDTANKVGTYQLAIAAQYHGVPFFVAAPTTTLDLSMSSGADIEIEERPAAELTSIAGVVIAPPGIGVWNPAFDVTPSSLIRGIVTEVGVIEAASDSSDGVIRIADFLRAYVGRLDPSTGASKVLTEKCFQSVEPIAIPTGYSRLTEKDIAKYIVANTRLAAMLQVTSSEASRLSIREVGDGNLNYVYIVTGPTGNHLVVKQALPYVRCVGESWPLTLRRAYFEQAALREQARLTGGSGVPEVFHFDERNALIFMQYVEPPHMILRKALISNLRICSFACDIGVFMAKTLFGSSALALDGGSLRNKIAHWSQNVAMCALTEKVIFTDPYTSSSMNRWTTPQLDGYALGIRSDDALRLAAAYHKSLFLHSSQALLHGDLHTGSVMVREGSTFVIDPEFAFYGPMGFDVGAVLANLFLSYFSRSVDGDQAYSEWLLDQTTALHDAFTGAFIDLWNSASRSGLTGELYPADIYSEHLLRDAQRTYLALLWRDTVGFTGMKMIRRVVGIAHVEDLESIVDTEVRSVCEKRCLVFARRLVMASYTGSIDSLESIAAVVEYARNVYRTAPPEGWTFA